jgi:exopolyphosphatase/guanosine-5'-triphosphate,3'-diphosphate pyrophosphatase
MVDAEAALGHPIEVISGIEEARLIYNGVTQSLPRNDGHRLVLDIGGGSTELILGEGSKPRTMESLHLGCVSMTERFFSSGCLTRKAFDRARIAARLELRPVKAFFRGLVDVESIGTSGTVRSAERVASALGIMESGELTLAVVEDLIERVLEFDSIETLSLRGLSERRAQVWPGGLSILAELLGVLRIEALRVSNGALREGLLYDLLGRLSHEDARERTVQAMMTRYNVDNAQAGRVATTARKLFDQCAGDWHLPARIAGKILEWSANLHEIGLDISHDGFHRHGAYVAENADMPGFPREEQRILAFLIGSQRHQISVGFETRLPQPWRESALRMVMLLRLAVLLNRSRNSAEIPAIELSVTDRTLDLRFDSAWLRANPLTVSDLERERAYLEAIDYELSFG